MSKAGTIKIAGIEASLSSHEEAIASTRTSIKRYLTNEHPDMLVLPEKWVMDKYDSGEEKLSELLEEFMVLSSDFQMVMVPGSLNVVRSGKLYNSSPIIANGKLLGWSDKISLFRRELGTYSSGKEIRVYTSGGVNFSVAICYDLDFPYFTKMAVRNGARILLNPSLISKDFHKMWHIYVRGRSLENRIPVISVNSASVPFEGRSIATSMQETEGGILLMEKFAKTQSLFTKIDYENTRSLIEARMREDPGGYSLDKIVDE